MKILLKIFSIINNKKLLKHYMAKKELNMFSQARIKFNELYDDAISYIKTLYGNVGNYFSNSSPFGQLLRVTLHLGRLILAYIEDSITELNINTASREQSIKGLATLTGHNPSRGMAARGSVKFTYNNSGEYANQMITIPNYTKLINNNNGLKYLIVLPADNMKMMLSNSNSYNNISIIQGDLKYQQATGNGEALQSFNFATNINPQGFIDNFFVNVYVNGEKWRTVESILDMTLNEKACIIKTSQTSGVDVFFGNGLNGRAPENGAIILFEYLLTSGNEGNINMLYQNNNNWKFEGVGYLDNGAEIDLNEVLSISTENSILFGTHGESVLMTKLLAPHTSRSYVLANKINYEYFLRKLNIFSIIDVIHGFETFDDNTAKIKYETANNNYKIAYQNYVSEVNLTGRESQNSKDLYDILLKAKKDLNYAELILNDSKLDDNTIYLFLIPDITTRINDTDNYFTCDIKSFKLSDDEKSGILDLIQSSGQQIITVDNYIIDPKTPHFAINCFIQIWEDHEFNHVKGAIISAISDYLISNTRRDRIPVSDIIKVVENVQGVDSVTIQFDADKQNEKIYGYGNYGIDDFGDILLDRYTVNSLHQNVKISDILPLFRGDWENKDGIYYSDNINDDNLSAINISLRGISKKDSINKNIIAR